MNVHGVGISILPGNSAGRGAGVSNRPAPTVTTESEPSESPKVNGAVRLLQEGHFKGVADARLRINFHEEISQLSSQAVGNDFDNSLATFFSSVGEEYANLVEGSGGTEEQVASLAELFDGFKSSINDLANAFLNGGGTNFSSVAVQFESEFESFIVNVQAVLQPAPVESPDSTTTAEIPVDDSFFDEFRAAFAEQLSQLTASVASSASVVPEISEPTGNGVAYARFVEILDGLNAASSGSEPEPILSEVLA